jgi:hypothetical protein
LSDVISEPECHGDAVAKNASVEVNFGQRDDVSNHLLEFGSEVSLKLEIDAEVPSGLDRAKVRTLLENANTLDSSTSWSGKFVKGSTIFVACSAMSPQW